MSKQSYLLLGNSELTVVLANEIISFILATLIIDLTLITLITSLTYIRKSLLTLLLCFACLITRIVVTRRGSASNTVGFMVWHYSSYLRIDYCLLSLDRIVVLCYILSI